MILSGDAMTAAVAAKQEDHAGPRAVLAQGRAVLHRAAVPGRAAVGGSVQGAQGRSGPDADGARLLLEGPQAADPRARRRARLAFARDRRSGEGPRHLPEADGDGRRRLRAPVRWQRNRVRAPVPGLCRTCHRGDRAAARLARAISTTATARRGLRRRSPPCPIASTSG